MPQNRVQLEIAILSLKFIRIVLKYCANGYATNKMKDFIIKLSKQRYKESLEDES